MDIWNAIPEITNARTLQEWCEDRHLYGHLECQLPWDEYVRIWRIHSGAGDWKFPPEATFDTPFNPINPFAPNPNMQFRFTTPTLATQSVTVQVVDDCRCDGWTLWKHPSGCKCGWASRKRWEKKIKGMASPANKNGDEFSDDFDWSMVRGYRG